ncbi:MAG: ATPase [Actinomycetia bacterium]|jgi:N-acetylglucosamine kinase-like BadF-type ATPase|nr:ATPase [Actinomycetes bacterium]
MGLILGVDGGNSKTELLVATTDGEPVAYLRGAGTNSHGVGVQGVVVVVGRMLEHARIEERPGHGVFFLCGADVPSDIAELAEAVERAGWVGEARVDNDTFALLRAGSDAADAVAVVCGAGINCVGRAADGRIARYPGLGWETGDWGGSEMLGRDALFHAARAEDGRGDATVLADALRAHFGIDVAALGEDIHYKRLRSERLGEIAPAVLDAAERGDTVACQLVGRLAEEIALLAVRGLRDLGLLERPSDTVLGGGMLGERCGVLVGEVVARLERRAPQTRPVLAPARPVLGSALAALDAAGVPLAAHEHLRERFAGMRVEDVRER